MQCKRGGKWREEVGAAGIEQGVKAPGDDPGPLFPPCALPQEPRVDLGQWAAATCQSALESGDKVKTAHLFTPLRPGSHLSSPEEIASCNRLGSKGLRWSSAFLRATL